MEQDILTEIEEIQEKLDTTYLVLSEKISNLKKRIEKHNFLHQNCANKGFSDIPLSTITFEEVAELANTANEFPAHILIDKLSDQEKTTTVIVRIATDGSIVNKRGRKVGAYAVYYSEASPLNEAGLVNNTASSMLPEVAAIVRALQISKDEGLQMIMLITDNMASIIFTSLAKQPATNSRKLQEFLSENPKLEDYAKQIETLMKSFRFVAIVWQKSHTNERTVNSRANEAADTLARERANEILMKLTQ